MELFASIEGEKCVPSASNRASGEYKVARRFIDGYERSYGGGERKSFDSDDMFFGSGFGSGSVSSFGSPPFGSPPLQGRGVTGPYNLWQDANTEPVRAKSYSSPERPKLVLLPRSKSVR